MPCSNSAPTSKPSRPQESLSLGQAQKVQEVGRLGGSYAASGDLAIVDKGFYGTVKTPGRREHLVVVDPQTGQAQPVGPLVDATTGAALPDVFGLVYRNGRLFGFLLGGPIVTIDPKTARCTVVARTGIGWYGATEYFRL